MLTSLLMLVVLQAAQANNNPFLACKEEHYHGLMERYREYFASDSQLAANMQQRTASVTDQFQRDFDRAAQVCDQRFPDRNRASFENCLRTRTLQACDTAFPPRNAEGHAACYEGAINSGAQRFNQSFAQTVGAQTPQAQAMVQRFQDDYARELQKCANLLENSPVNTALNSCESAGTQATQACTVSTPTAAAPAAAPTGTTPGSSQATSVACSQSANDSANIASTLQQQKSNCASSISSCESSCSSAQSQLSSIPQDQRASFQSRASTVSSSCNSAKSGLSNIEASLAQAQNVQTRSNSCLRDTNAGQVSEVCKANPQAPGCGGAVQDCNNPTFASQNPTQCARPAATALNPGSPTSSSAPAPTTSADSMSSLFGSGHGGNAGTAADGSSLTGSDAGSSTGHDGSRADNTSGLQGQTDAQMSLKGGANTPGVKTTGPSADAPAPAPSALIGSAPGAWNQGPTPTDPALAGSYSTSGSWIPPKMDDGVNPGDMNRFRPNLVPAVRGPASEVLPSGILASHVNIWKRMNQTYFRLTPSFLASQP